MINKKSEELGVTLKLTIRQNKKTGLFVLRGNWDGMPKTGADYKCFGEKYLAKSAAKAEAHAWYRKGFGRATINGLLVLEFREPAEEEVKPAAPKADPVPAWPKDSADTQLTAYNEDGQLVNVVKPGRVPAPAAVMLAGIKVYTEGPGSNFNYRISRAEAGRLLSLGLPDGLPFDIMAAGAGTDADWIAIESGDYEEDASGQLMPDADHGPFEIWVPVQSLIEVKSDDTSRKQCAAAEALAAEVPAAGVEALETHCRTRAGRSGYPFKLPAPADPVQLLAANIADIIDNGHSTELSVLTTEIRAALLKVQAEAGRMLEILGPAAASGDSK